MRSDEILFSLETALEKRKHAHQFRQRRTVEPLDATHVRIDGKTFVNFASNNYVGLTHHPRLIEASSAATLRHGTGAGAAALITGYTPEHAAAEQAIAAWKGTERAVLLPSGYQANQAAIQTVAGVAEGSGRGVRFLLDKLAHASLIDAVRATGAPFRVFPHNHLPKLERLLAEADPAEMQVVVTESIFSMDGDAADLAGLADLKRRHPFVLLLDEAHASGVYGPAGAGLASEIGLSTLADLTTVTLSKALGSLGGAVCCSAAWGDALVNFGRASIYTTNVPPSLAATARAAIEVLRDEPQHQARVRSLARHVRSEIASLGFGIPSGDSPIIPLVLGEEALAVAAAERLREGGLLAVAVRPPTVPPGTSRLRITLSGAHSDEEIALLLATLATLPRPQA